MSMNSCLTPWIADVKRSSGLQMNNDKVNVSGTVMAIQSRDGRAHL